jgi:phosphoesterase RecJ-like protein
MPEKFDYIYSDTTVPATCQMVYHFIQENHDEKLVSKEAAECLYTGIMTDTEASVFGQQAPLPTGLSQIS